MAGPQYTVKDLIYFTGFISGIILVYLGLEPMGISPIIRLIGGLVVGVGMGWVLLKVYEGKTYTGDDDSEKF